MKIFTVGNSSAELGVLVEEQQLKGADVTITVISVGEQGRGRIKAYIPVANATPEEKVTNVTLGKTRTGNPKFIAISPDNDTDTTDKCIVVMKHTAGYRGGAKVTGDRIDWNDVEKGFHPSPLLTLVQGVIAQGIAGRMGGNSQYIAELPANKVFRISRSGRLYGAPKAMYGMYDGATIKMVSWEERIAADLWFD